MEVVEPEIRPRYLDYRGAARYTGLSRWTLMRAHEKGVLPASRVGSAVRFAVEDLDRFMRVRRS